MKDVAMVRVEDPEPMSEGGLKLALAAGGRPLTLRSTVLEIPGVPTTPTEKLVAALVVTLCAGGLAETVKSNTFSMTVAARVRPPPVPVMVNG